MVCDGTTGDLARLGRAAGLQGAVVGASTVAYRGRLRQRGVVVADVDLATVGTSIVESLIARDFSVNAAALDARLGVLVDPAGAVGAVARGELDTIGEPAETFLAQPLAPVRALRFAADGELRLSGRVLVALRRHSWPCEESLRARTFDELLKAEQAGLALPMVEVAREAGVADRLVVGLQEVPLEGAGSLDEVLMRLAGAAAGAGERLVRAGVHRSRAKQVAAAMRALQ